MLEAFGTILSIIVNTTYKATQNYFYSLDGRGTFGGKWDVRSQPRTGDFGTNTDVVAPPPGKLFSETNDKSVGILLTYGKARVLLSGDAEKK